MNFISTRGKFYREQKKNNAPILYLTPKKNVLQHVGTNKFALGVYNW